MSEKGSGAVELCLAAVEKLALSGSRRGHVMAAEVARTARFVEQTVAGAKLCNLGSAACYGRQHLSRTLVDAPLAASAVASVRFVKGDLATPKPG